MIPYLRYVGALFSLLPPIRYLSSWLHVWKLKFFSRYVRVRSVKHRPQTFLRKRSSQVCASILMHVTSHMKINS